MAKPEKRTCFFLSTIGGEKSPERLQADKVLKHLVRKALESDFIVTRGDEETNPGAITPAIIAAILDADVVIADMSGLNPNVFYELAIAHGFRKPTVLIQTASDRIPFDVKDMRTLKYNMADPEELETAQRLLRTYALAAESDTSPQITPLSSAERFASIADSADPVAQSNVQVMESIAELGQQIRRDMRRLMRGSPAIREERMGTVTAPSVSDGAYRPSDLESLIAFVERLAERDVFLPEDFAGMITMQTSGDFDSWIQDIANAALPPGTRTFIFSEELLAAPQEEEEDEPASGA